MSQAESGSKVIVEIAQGYGNYILVLKGGETIPLLPQEFRNPKIIHDLINSLRVPVQDQRRK